MGKAKHIPIRMCCICRKRAPKRTLARYVGVPGVADPVLDREQIVPGRGAYLCGEPRCEEAFIRRTAQRKGKGQKK
jgi:Predicted nucleic-acid-binding protein implicated in transcription termination